MCDNMFEPLFFPPGPLRPGAGNYPVLGTVHLESKELCPNILKFADVWQPSVDGRTFNGVGFG